MERVAQTNIQLYNQVRAQGRGTEDLVLLKRAYEFSTTLYSGWFQADGKPFVAHTVGVASILAHLGCSTEVVAAGLLHNVYGNGDFGDGRILDAGPARRRVVREGVGEIIENLVYRFRDFRITPRSVDTILARIDRLDDTERALLLMDVADRLEKFVDQGVHYFGDGDWVTGDVALLGGRIVEIARRMGRPEVGDMLARAYAQAESSSEEIPPEMRASNGRPVLGLVVPRSCRLRRDNGLRAWARRALVALHIFH
jgi:hypothetical protein